MLKHLMFKIIHQVSGKVSSTIPMLRVPKYLPVGTINKGRDITHSIAKLNFLLDNVRILYYSWLFSTKEIKFYID